MATGRLRASPAPGRRSRPADGHLPGGRDAYAAETSFLGALADQAATDAANAQLLAAARRKVALEERQRLARELHDSVSHSLYTIQVGAQMARERLDQDSAGIAQPIDYVLRLADRDQAGAAPDRPGGPLEHSQARPGPARRGPHRDRRRLSVAGDRGPRCRVRPQPELPRAPRVALDARGATGVGGACEVVSSRGRGTRVVVRVPSVPESPPRKEPTSRSIPRNAPGREEAPTPAPGEVSRHTETGP